MMFGWYIGLVGITIGLIGCISFLNSLSKLSGELKKSLSFLVIASLIYIVFSSVMIIFGLLKYNVENVWWQIVPFLYSVSAIFFAIGSVRLIKLLENLQRKIKVDKNGQ